MTKDHILSEIRRITSENGGTPPGSHRFFSETGIKETDWRGRHWVRWGDALMEAGFQPNQFTPAHSDEALLNCLAAVVQELGHFPVQAELTLKRRTDPKFPSPKTLERFGGKAALASRLRQFLLERGNTNLAAICAQAAEAANGKPASAPDEPDDPEWGFVYLMKSGRFFKVGKSNSVGRRERELAIQLPEKAKVIHAIKTDDPAGIEEYWHKRFHDRRKNGEWFELTAMDVTAFRRRKFM